MVAPYSANTEIFRSPAGKTPLPEQAQALSQHRLLAAEHPS